MTLRQSRFALSRQTGFGLLEVLVSLVIFAGVGFSVLAWFQQSVDTTQRLRAFYEVQATRREILEIAKSINPMVSRRGERSLGAVRVVWDSQPEGNEAVQVGYPSGVGRHRLQLYVTTFTAYRGKETAPWFVEKLTLIGHRLESAPLGASSNG